MQSSKQEISDGLTACVGRAIAEYKARNKESLPERIIIYRDGVGDGQLQYIHEHELPQIQTFIGESDSSLSNSNCILDREKTKPSSINWEPQLAYIVLKKRINQRFFRTNEVRLIFSEYYLTSHLFRMGNKTTHTQEQLLIQKSYAGICSIFCLFRKRFVKEL